MPPPSIASEQCCELSVSGLNSLSYRYVCLEGNSAPCPSDGIHGYRCPSGFYCPAGSGLELPCEPGTFSPLPGAGVCLPCPAGMACGSAATVEPLRCPRGEQHVRAANPVQVDGKRCDGSLHPASSWLSRSAGSSRRWGICRELEQVPTAFSCLCRAGSDFPLSMCRLLLSSSDCCPAALPRGDAELFAGGIGPHCLQAVPGGEVLQRRC